MSAEALRALEWLPWIAGAWVLLWAVDCVVTHVRWPHGGEGCVTGVELANEGEETRGVLGDLLARLDDIHEELRALRDAPEVEAADRARERGAGRSFSVSGPS